MIMKNLTVNKSVVVLLLAIFVFVLGNLIFNVENLYIGEELSPEFYGPQIISGHPVASYTTLGDAIRYLWYAALIICGCVIIISIFSFAFAKDKKKWRKLAIKLALSALACLMVFGVIFAAQHVKSGSYESMNPVLSNVGEGGNAGNGTSLPIVEPPTGMKVLVSFGIVFLAFGVIVLASVGIFTLLNMRSGKLAYDKGDLQAKEMAQTVQTAIETLYKGSDAKSTIIRCYNDMCKAMAKHGLADEECLTPREFETLAEKTLPISKVHLHALVCVFEEARYSAHALSPKEGQRAKLCLEKVLDDLVKSKENTKGECPSGE